MHSEQSLVKGAGPTRNGAPPGRRTIALSVGAVAVCSAGLAFAAEGSPAPVRSFPVAQVFTFLFLMLGPFKIIGPFARITKGADARLTRRIAVQAMMLSVIALLIAGLLGETLLDKYGIPLPVLALSAGVILFLVALRNLLEQFEPPAPGLAGTEAAPTTNAMKLATTLAFPTVVTPYGVAALVVFLAMSQSAEARLTIAGIVVAIMALNLVVMLVTGRLLAGLSLVLPILGAVLGIVQVALGLQIISNSLRAMGVL